MLRTLLWAMTGTGFTFLMTTLGAAMVFFFRKRISDRFQRFTLGFAAGVMIAASVWSLLIPAIRMSEQQGLPPWLPAAAGFCLGVLFLQTLDVILPRLHMLMGETENENRKHTVLLVLAITLHNIPEGMAVGLSFALAARSASDVTLATAAALALGIGIQNFPEGAAVSLPLGQDGMGRGKAFVCGSLSGIVEPVFGLIAVALAGQVEVLLPWLLGFAAGSMLYVVVEELIPQANRNSRHQLGTVGAMVGFLVMMVLDVCL